MKLFELSDFVSPEAQELLDQIDGLENAAKAANYAERYKLYEELNALKAKPECLKAKLQEQLFDKFQNPLLQFQVAMYAISALLDKAELVGEVQQTLHKSLQTYSTVVYSTEMCDVRAEFKARALTAYMAYGFSRDEAMQLLLTEMAHPMPTSFNSPIK